MTTDPVMERAKRIAADAVRHGLRGLPPEATRQVTVTMTAFRAAQVGRVLLARARDLRRRSAKSGFVPEKGSVDRNLINAEALEAIAREIEARLPPGVPLRREDGE